MYDTILFDLDGTLTDSAPGITRSVAHALAKYGIQAPLEDLKVFVGPPLAESFRKFYGIEDTAQAIDFYREYYQDRGMFENEPYPGILELLKAAKAAGKKLVVCTSKPEEFAKIILDHFGLSPCLDGIFGATMDEKRVEKADIIEYARAHMPMEHPVMVGDRKHDILGAKACGLDSIGVLYGYGSRQELEAAGADQIVETVDDLKSLLLAS